VKLRRNRRFDFIRPLAGTLQGDFQEARLIHIPLDEKRGLDREAWSCRWRRSFGILVANPRAGGRSITSIVPYAHGGNLDNQEPAAMLCLPISSSGALFSCGDGHGSGRWRGVPQAIAPALQGTFELSFGTT
jgi:acetamidase/formamidase